MVCPDCGGKMVKDHKGWCVCPDREFSLIRKRRYLRGKAERVEREARPRLRPLSREKLRILMEPYLTPDVERLLNQ